MAELVLRRSVPWKLLVRSGRWRCYSIGAARIARIAARIARRSAGTAEETRRDGRPDGGAKCCVCRDTAKSARHATKPVSTCTSNIGVRFKCSGTTLVYEVLELMRGTIFWVRICRGTSQNLLSFLSSRSSSAFPSPRPSHASRRPPLGPPPSPPRPAWPVASLFAAGRRRPRAPVAR